MGSAGDSWFFCWRAWDGELPGRHCGRADIRPFGRRGLYPGEADGPAVGDDPSGQRFQCPVGGYLRDLWGYRAGVLGVFFGFVPGYSCRLFSYPGPPRLIDLPSSKQPFWHGWREALQTKRGRRLLTGRIGSQYLGRDSDRHGIFVSGPPLGHLRISLRSGHPDRHDCRLASGLALDFRYPLCSHHRLVIRPIGKGLYPFNAGWCLLISLLGVVILDGSFLILSLAFLFVSSAGLHVTL